jgi:hypothetical protein
VEDNEVYNGRWCERWMFGFYANAMNGASDRGFGHSRRTDNGPELIHYTCKLSTEEQEKTATPDELRVALAHMLWPASEYILSYVSEYVSRESIDGIVTLEARRSNTSAWTAPSDEMVTTCLHKNLLKADQEERSIRNDGVVEPEILKTIPALEYRIAVKNDSDLVFAIHVCVTLKRSAYDAITRQITAAVYNHGKLDSTWSERMHQFSNGRNPYSLLALPQAYSADLLWLCDYGVVQSVARLVTPNSSSRELVLYVDANLPGNVYGSQNDISIIKINGKLRQSIDDPIFMHANEEISHKTKATKTFQTVSTFIDWAKRMDLQSNGWEHPVKLTRNNPNLLTTATLIRMLNMLDDFSFIPQS